MLHLYFTKKNLSLENVYHNKGAYEDAVLFSLIEKDGLEKRRLARQLNFGIKKLRTGLASLF